MEIKDQVKNAVSIVDVVSLYVDLKPAGKSLKGLCPFHQEKTPSFYVTPEKGTFTCYGCHAYGDIFTMVQQQEGLSFPEALRFLIEHFHLPLSPQHQKNDPPDYYDQINTAALTFFEQQLWSTSEGRTARQYLTDRGLCDETLKTFHVGLAPNTWDQLRLRLEGHGFTARQGLDMGLLATSEQGRVYDRFRNRIIVPIFSMNDKVLAFGGRALDDQPAKYINSPETPLYKKGHHLFAFNLARQHVRTEKSLILVEGYFDQISLYQHGIKHAVAGLGTALTDEQAYLIKRFADLVYICYDNDPAGQKAASAAVEKLLIHQVSTRVVPLQGGKDPDEIVRTAGPSALLEQISQSTEGFRFLLQRMAENTDLKDPVSKSRVIQNLSPIIQKVDDRVVRLDLIKKCEDFFNIPFEEINRLFTGPRAEANLQVPPDAMPTLAEVDFLRTLLRVPVQLQQLTTLLNDEMMRSLSIGSIIRCMLEVHAQTPQSLRDPVLFSSHIMQKLGQSDRKLVQNLLEKPAPTIPEENPDQTLERCMIMFYDRQNKRSVEHLNRQIHMAEQNGDRLQAMDLMKKKSLFIKTIRDKKQTMSRSSEGAIRRS
jgi:DNA primase